MDASGTAWILGAGMTGLAASWASGVPALEAQPHPGGVCRSYFVRPNQPGVLLEPPAGGDAYRFEIGGGHWLFGADAVLERFLSGFANWQAYERRAAVFLPDRRLLVPYPIQYNLGALGRDLARRCLEEMGRSPVGQARTLADWLDHNFGPTLMELFFAPFHELYTAGLWTRVAPEDQYKTPVDFALAGRGAAGEPSPAGYNRRLLYPIEGLSRFTQALARGGQVENNARVARIDVARRRLEFESGRVLGYESLVSTLPLNRMLDLTGIQVDEPPGLATSVAVLNLGARRGPSCPAEHWVYVPASRAGFHRVGFYSNVDPHFLPRGSTDRVSLYVERAFRSGERMSPDEETAWAETVEQEIRDWGFIAEVEARSFNWVEPAHTWTEPGSRWRELALQRLAAHGILMTGRYAKWRFQGIADSLRDGLLAGAALRAGQRRA